MEACGVSFIQLRLTSARLLPRWKSLSIARVTRGEEGAMEGGWVLEEGKEQILISYFI